MRNRGSENCSTGSRGYRAPIRPQKPDTIASYEFRWAGVDSSKIASVYIY